MTSIFGSIAELPEGSARAGETHGTIANIRSWAANPAG
jgi:hypothetical protein